MDQGKKVWAPDLKEGFQLGEICDFGTDTLSVQPETGGKVLVAPYDAVYPAEEKDAKAVEDNCALMYLNEATLLHNLRRRFMEDKIYTYTANILVAINPYHSLPMYSSEIIKQYNGKSLGTLPPHVYAVADKAYRDMRNLGLSQGMIVSGESGAGKTESTKHVLRYLTDSYGGGGATADLESRILAANPFLEAFGNAKTTRNNNSSRFGKFVELHFNKNSRVVGAHIEHYLLEKSRVISQSEKERNYHVFYRMCKGAPDSMRNPLNLQPDVSKYRYLESGIKDEVEGLDDVKDFAVMEKSMNDVGLEGKEKSNVFRLCAAVLHIGNIEFQEDSQGQSSIMDKCKTDLAGLAKLIGLTPEAMETALCKTVISIAGTESMKGKTLKDAGFGRDALGKAVYSKLFDWIVGRINTCFPYTSSENFIGVLDIAGFEYFQHNTFEQFCINYCNEKLQQFFNERILKDEQELYVKESIKFKEVEYADNQDCIDLIELKGTGILSMLDEESKIPKASDKTFTSKVHNQHKGHFRLQIPRKSKMSYYKQLRDDEGFIIRHFAGAVCYETDLFIDKNNDALTADLAFLMDTSADPFTKGLFTYTDEAERPKRGKMTLVSLGSKFKVALQTLMEKLHSTRSNFIRCIKPNQKMSPKLFSGGEILSQLQCAGMVSVLDLMQGGFPSRTQFQDLYNMYAPSLPPVLKSLDPRTFCQALFKALGLNEDDFQFGVSKVFFRPGKFAEFDTIMKGDKDNIAALVQKVMVWLVRQRWKKMAWACVSSLKFALKIRARGASAITMQKVMRMYFAKSVHRPRFLGIRNLTALRAQVSVLHEVVDRLKKNKEKFEATVKSVENELDAVIAEIKSNESMTREQIQAKATKLEASCDKQLQDLKKEQEKQKMAEEADRLRKLAEEMEAARLAKEKEAAARSSAEREAKERKEHEEEARKEAEEDEKAQEKLRIQSEKDEANQKLQKKKGEEAQAEAQEMALLEQERRDHDLAMRLAQDAGAGSSAALSDEARKTTEAGGAARRKSLKRNQAFPNKKQEALHKKHDLSKWKYADLRDTINTSCNIDLLEACREEFHRRLKVYHAWKMKNMKKKEQEGAAGRAPTALHQSAAGRSAAPAPPPAKKKAGQERQQRFFRIPFIRPTDQAKEGYKKKGWWFAHFDGQWIARQMELHPEKDPVLLIAGRDDMEMCELSLDETGLSRKRGAEILPREFEEEWKRCGGQPYVKASPAGKK